MIVVGAGAVSLLEATAGLPAPLLPPDSGTALGDDGYVLVGGGSSKWLALSGRPGSPRGTSYGKPNADFRPRKIAWKRSRTKRWTTAAVEFLEAVGLKFLACA